MFKDANKFQEKELTKQEIIANLKRKERKGEIAHVSPPKRDEKLTTEEFIEQMEQVSSHNRTFKLPQEDEEEEKNSSAEQLPKSV